MRPVRARLAGPLPALSDPLEPAESLASRIGAELERPAPAAAKLLTNTILQRHGAAVAAVGADVAAEDAGDGLAIASLFPKNWEVEINRAVLAPLTIL